MPLKVEVMGGLCSRLRAAVGGMAWCDSHNATLLVNWPSAEHIYPTGFEAKLSDLWQLDDRVYETDRIQRLPKNKGQLNGTHPSIRTCHIEDFLPYFTPDKTPGYFMRRYRLNETVQSHYDSVSLAKNAVGVHIRYDISQPGTAEPRWFVNRMEQFSEGQQFFLSCDSQYVSDLIHESFPGRVTELDKDYVYDKAGIQKSMADLYILANKCAWVIGANHSSYSQMACLMRGGRYLGPHDKPHGLSGGFYEDLWNGPNEQEFMEVFGHALS